MKTDITIKETIDRYDTFRDEVAGKSVREMFEKLKLSAKEGEYVSNDTYFHALFLTEMMFSSTKNSLRILTGCDIVRFLDALYTPFISACKRISNSSDGIVRIVSLIPTKEHFEGCRENLQEFFDKIKKDCPELSGKIKGLIKVLPADIAKSVNEGTNKSFSHYLIADNMVRIEDPHGILDEKAPASSIKAKVFFNAPKAAREISASFDKCYFNESI